MKKFTERKLALVTLLVITVIVLVACGGKSNSDGDDSRNNNDSNTSADVKLEILSWWTAGGEADALNAILDGFHEEYSNIQIENAAVAGGGGANSQAVLSSRLQGGDPPAIFQAQGGMDLLRWHDAGYLENLNDVFAENNWGEVFPKEIIEMNSIDGDIYGLPMNIHRNNMIWYNKQIFEELDLEIPTSFDEFIEVSKELQANDIIPVALGDQTSRWTTLWFDVLLLDELGAEKYAQLWNGEISLDDPAVVVAAENLKEVLSFINDNHSSLDWQDATDLIINGEAAMQLMGDWASGYFESKGWEPNEDYAWFPAPGTGDYFNVVNDSMGFPTGVKNAEEAKQLLTYMGSEKGQVDFNLLKGSIPARLDVDTSEFNTYSKSAAEDFKNSQITISLAGGSPVPAGFIGKVDDSINAFVTQKDVDRLIKDLLDAQSLLID